MNYEHIIYSPKISGKYLVQTSEGEYDFAMFDENGWGKGLLTGGDPIWWQPIPKRLG